MPQIAHYHAFRGRHWDTGTICNLLDYRGLRAPHTAQPVSEALLFGISGGVAVSYFVFEYPGFVPQVSIGTRYPFDPMEKIWTRLRLHPAIYTTSHAETAAAQLEAVIAGGQPALVWADMLSLPYNATAPLDDGFALMLPVLVYGYDVAHNVALLADRAQVALQITASELATARARSQQHQHRMVVLDPPATLDMEVLAHAVLAGIRDCISLYESAPPRGPETNFGFAALTKWATMLTDPNSVQGWARMFPAGAPLYAALTAIYGAIESCETGGRASRPQYAEFLSEAALILNRPQLHEVAARFQASAMQWAGLAQLVLPDDVPALHVTRTLLQHREHLLNQQGMAALPEVMQINTRLETIQHELSNGFPLNAAAVAELYAALHTQVQAIHAAEQEAITQLQACIA